MLRVQTVITGSAGAPYYSTDYFGGSTIGEALAARDASVDFWFQLQNFLDGAMLATIDQEVQVVDPATGLITGSFTNPPASVDFTGATEVLPRATQGLLRLRTGVFVGGRELRGRKFIPGILETSTLDGRPSAAMITAISNAFTAAGVEAGAAGDWQVYSPTHHVAANVSNHSVWSEFAVLRSRRQ